MENFNEELIIKKYMPKNDDIKTLSSFFYGFSDATRLKVIMLLTIKPLCVGDIVELLNINQTTISHQLKILRALNIVDCYRQGKSIVYFIKNNNITNMLDVTVDCV